MIRTKMGWAAAFVVAALALAGCGSGQVTQPTGPAVRPTSQPTTPARVVTSAAPVPASAGAAVAGKDIANFDPCSVVSDGDLVKAIIASAGDPSALGTINASHSAVDGADTG